MSRPECFVSFLPYSDLISNVFFVEGETEKYWKVSSGKNNHFLITKNTHHLRGSDIVCYPYTKQEVKRMTRKEHVINMLKKVNYHKVELDKLEEVIKILGVEK